MKGLDMKKANKAEQAPKRKIAWGRWYELITPFLGIKWGAEITLIGYGWLSGSDGLKLAAIIVTVFLFAEWCQMAWCEFKRRAQYENQ
jgi:hypothetical protein